MEKPKLFIIIDFECTCWDRKSAGSNAEEMWNKPTPEEMEVIEIGATAILPKGKTISEFKSFAKPRLHPQLSQFCKTLTHITQEQIDAAPHFSTVYRHFMRWVASQHDKVSASRDAEIFLAKTKRVPSNIVMMSWGKFDFTQLGRECRRMYTPIPFTKHINLKQMYSYLFDTSMKNASLKHALIRLNIPFEGTPHRGIDDARMITKVYTTLINKYKFFVLA